MNRGENKPPDAGRQEKAGERTFVIQSSLTAGLVGATLAQMRVAVVQLLGVAFMALGVTALITPPASGHVWLGIGFGGLQIAFGLYIARTHGG